MSRHQQPPAPTPTPDSDTAIRDSPDEPALSVWSVQPGSHTFSSEKIKHWAERHLHGTVCNLCAGPTQLDHDGPILRNDIDADIQTDLSIDAQLIASCLPDSSVDTVVFDPPFSERQARETYDVAESQYLPPGGAVLHEIDRILKPGGTLVQIGFQTPGMPPEFDYERSTYTIFNLLGRQHDWIGVVEEKPERGQSGHPPSTGEVASRGETSPEASAKDGDTPQVATYDIDTDWRAVSHRRIETNTPASDAETTHESGLSVTHVGLARHQDRAKQLQWHLQSLLAFPVLDVTPLERSFVGPCVIRCDPDDDSAEATVEYRDLAAHFDNGVFETVIFQPESKAFQQTTTYRGDTTGRDTAFKQEVPQIIAPGGRVIMIGRTISCMPAGTGFERESVTAFSHPDAAETLFVTVERKTDSLLSGWEPVSSNSELTEPHQCLRCGQSEAIHPAYTVTCPECGAPPKNNCGDIHPDHGTVIRPYGSFHDERLQRFENQHKQECAGWGNTHAHDAVSRQAHENTASETQQQANQQSLTDY